MANPTAASKNHILRGGPDSGARGPIPVYTWTRKPLRELADGRALSPLLSHLQRRRPLAAVVSALWHRPEGRTGYLEGKFRASLSPLFPGAAAWPGGRAAMVSGLRCGPQ